MSTLGKSTQDHSSFQTFLDENQYSRRSILRYERIFGNGYVSTGGKATTKDFCSKLNLKSGEKVLDVGCGIGGGDFYMAEAFHVTVHGVDLSSNMISIAEERNVGPHKNKVSFEICDVTKVQFPENNFDVIYSRDTILHIENKSALFSNFLKWLKPNGRLLISDYCRGNCKKHSEEFVDYVKNRGYHLLTVHHYGKLLEEAGFIQVEAEDLTSQFIDILGLEKERLQQDKSFTQDFTQIDYDELVDGWNSKIRRCSATDMAWGLFTAVKP